MNYLEIKQHFILPLSLTCPTSLSSPPSVSSSALLSSSLLSPPLPLFSPLHSPPLLLSPHPQAVTLPGTPATPTNALGTPRRSTPRSCPGCWWVTTPLAWPTTCVRPRRTAGTPSSTTAAWTTSAGPPSLSSSTRLRSTRSSCSRTRRRHCPSRKQTTGLAGKG